MTEGEKIVQSYGGLEVGEACEALVRDIDAAVAKARREALLEAAAMTERYNMALGPVPEMVKQHLSNEQISTLEHILRYGWESAMRGVARFIRKMAREEVKNEQD